jgi:hypothetical protein
MRLDLLGEPESADAVRRLREAMLEHPAVRGLIGEFAHWDDDTVCSHKSAGLLLHKLVFLADIGVKADDPGMGEVIARVRAHTDADGILQVPGVLPEKFGGTGQPDWGWALCDTPSIFYALAKMGLSGDTALRHGAERLAALVRGNGWPCAVSGELGKFRGPGRKDDPCPYATLVMLKALLVIGADRFGRECRIAAETLLHLWETSRAQHPYMFYMGTDFRKLKAPLVWYDILHIADTLSQCGWLRGDARLLDMAAVIEAAADERGLYTAQSQWKAWNGWEFAQKKAPSAWITFLALRILKSLGMTD